MHASKLRNPADSASGRPAPVYLIGLDAADWLRVQDFCQDGTMPHLAAFLANAAQGVLDSPADAYAGGVWPDFYTGKSVARHGIYHNKLWRAEAMRVEVPTDAWLPERPFHEDLSGRGLRVCAIDVPMVLGRPRPLRGLYLGGWGTHDLISQGSWPTDLWTSLVQRHGAPCMPVEHFGAQQADDLLRLESQLQGATAQITSIAVELLRQEAPDFACVVLGGDAPRGTLSVGQLAARHRAGGRPQGRSGRESATRLPSRGPGAGATPGNAAALGALHRVRRAWHGGQPRLGRSRG